MAQAMPDGVQQKELESSLVERIKGSIVEYFNGHALLDCPFIKAPSSLPAPVGKYVAVRVEDVGRIEPGLFFKEKNQKKISICSLINI